MHLVTFEVGAGLGLARRSGVLSEDGQWVWDANAVVAADLASSGERRPTLLADVVVPSDMLGLLAAGPEALDRLRAATTTGDPAGADPLGRALRYPLPHVRLLSPLPRPHSIRDFLLVKEHVENSYKRLPPDKQPPHSIEDIATSPGYYKGNPDTVYGPGDTIPFPAYTDQLDYELELAVVIGVGGRNIIAEDAGAHIAGYTIFNDWSARDVQMAEMRIGLGPGLGKDFANSLGPVIRTPDGFDPVTATMVARIDGEEWSRGTIGAMIRTFPELIEWLSRAQELRPGDVIGSGTIANGCGLELGRYLQPGNLVELEVDGIGLLQNRVGPRT